MTVVLLAGTIAGLLLAALQVAAVVPLIHAAEGYEHEHAAPTSAASGGERWRPSDGLERTIYTVAGTVLTGIAFSALLFGAASLLGLQLDWRRGLVLGLAGFACCTLAPAIGLPPTPPGAATSPLVAAQAWWVSTALTAAVGLCAFVRAQGRWGWRVAGMVCLLAPHVLGAPRVIGSSLVPSDLNRQFVIASVATQGVFWLLLGGLGSSLYARAFPRSPGSPG
jgi:cobalt transporter subunit CbtA